MSGRAVAQAAKVAAPVAQQSASGILQRKCACGQHTPGGGECDYCRNEGAMLRRRSTGAVPAGGVGTAPPIVYEVLRSPGRPLGAATRAFFEPRFGQDFSHVRIHTDSRASLAARSVNALAYTVGRDIHFRDGQFAPQTAEGRELLAHELTHVVQQRNAITGSPLQISHPRDPGELEASRVATSVMHGQAPEVQTGYPPALRRQDAGTLSPGDAGGGDAGAGSTGVLGSGAAPGSPAAPALPGAAAPPAMATLAGLKATRSAFKTSGPLDPENCAALKPSALGVGIGGSASNGMELAFHIDGPIPAGTEFDILRTRTDTAWERDAGGTWTRIQHCPAGTNDDHSNRDECLIPSASRRIFSDDGPGLAPGRNPRGVTVHGGSAVSATATGFVIKHSFSEWVIARNTRLGINWAPISEPTFTLWHSVTSLALIGGTWSLVNTPSGQENEIKLGSISVAGATP